MRDDQKKFQDFLGGLTATSQAPRETPAVSLSKSTGCLLQEQWMGSLHGSTHLSCVAPDAVNCKLVMPFGHGYLTQLPEVPAYQRGSPKSAIKTSRFARVVFESSRKQFINASEALCPCLSFSGSFCKRGC